MVGCSHTLSTPYQRTPSIHPCQHGLSIHPFNAPNINTPDQCFLWSYPFIAYINTSYCYAIAMRNDTLSNIPSCSIHPSPRRDEATKQPHSPTLHNMSSPTIHPLSLSFFLANVGGDGVASGTNQHREERRRRRRGQGNLDTPLLPPSQISQSNSNLPVKFPSQKRLRGGQAT